MAGRSTRKPSPGVVKRDLTFSKIARKINRSTAPLETAPSDVETSAKRSAFLLFAFEKRSRIPSTPLNSTRRAAPRLIPGNSGFADSRPTPDAFVINIDVEGRVF